MMNHSDQKQPRGGKGLLVIGYHWRKAGADSKQKPWRNVDSCLVVKSVLS